MKLAFTFALCAAMTATAWADKDGGRNNGNNNKNQNNGGQMEGQLIGSSVGQHVAGVPSGNAPWMIANSEFNISANGRIQVQIQGLLISAGALSNTIGPVTMVKASLVCGDVVAASTAPVNLSSAGEVRIDDTLLEPSPCIAPAVLIQIAATTTGPVANGAFIAVNSLGNGNNNANNNNGNNQNDGHDH
jgi:hypothetical protein